MASGRNSVMAHSFSEVPRANIPRSSFNRSHGYKTTFDADYLIPVLVDDVIPGDTFNVNMNFFARLATPLYPIMDNLYLESFFFFVPYRLVWDNWEKMHGAQDDPGDSISYTVPVITGASNYTGEGTLWDYFGLPIDNKSGAHFDPDDLTVSALPFRAYSLIWNEWFRDQNLQDSTNVQSHLDGPDTLVNSFPATSGVHSGVIKRGKRHDYFTSCLPNPQKGTSAVDLPFSGTIDVHADGVSGAIVTVDEGSAGTARNLDRDGALYVDLSAASTGTAKLQVDMDNLSGTLANINDLRLAMQTQRLLERDARSGTRYNELILAHFGVTVPDFRVQRPEFLGGGSSPINITPVAQTSAQTTPVANDTLGHLSAFGTVSGQHGFTKSFVEHGVVIGLVNVRGDITYSQGLERYWAKQTRYDFYYPVLSQIGEQAVYNYEIWAQGDGDTNDNNVFGYQERYAEYRYKPSRLTGLFGVDAASNLDEWHLSEDFTSLPTLGDTFIQSNTGTPLDRAIAVSTEFHFIFDAFFDMKCVRPLPLYGVPGNLDHF
jgi:hypothetical protein